MADKLQLVPAAPEAAGEAEAPERPLPEYPKTGRLEDILKWSLECTDTSAAEEHPTQLTEERRKFLEEAFRAMTVDVIQVVKDLLARLATPEDDAAPAEDKCDALEQLSDLAEDIDLAQNIQVLGGTEILLRLLDSKHPEVVALSLENIATGVQNNPICQDRAATLSTMRKVSRLLLPTQTPEVRTKAMRTVSCLIRDHGRLTRQFLEREAGLERIRGCLGSDNARLQTKAVVVLTTLLDSVESIPGAVVKSGLVPELAQLTAADDDTLREQALRCLVTLTAKHPAAVSALAAPELGFAKRLDARTSALRTLPEEERERLLEELEYCNTLRALL